MTSHSNSLNNLSVFSASKQFKVITVSYMGLDNLENILNEADIPATFSLVSTIHLEQDEAFRFIFASDLKEAIADLQSLIESSAELIHEIGQE